VTTASPTLFKEFLYAFEGVHDYNVVPVPEEPPPAGGGS
jgi:hypothetical protein